METTTTVAVPPPIETTTTLPIETTTTAAPTTTTQAPIPVVFSFREAPNADCTALITTNTGTGALQYRNVDFDDNVLNDVALPAGASHTEPWTELDGGSCRRLLLADGDRVGPVDEFTHLGRVCHLGRADPEEPDRSDLPAVRGGFRSSTGTR